MTAMTRPAPREGVEDHHIDNADDLLNILSPRHALWENDAPGWVFRGQADAEWLLKAKAVRDHAQFARYGVSRASLRPGYDPTEAPDWSKRVGLQARMLVRFKQFLDRAGLAIPWESPRIESRDFNRRSSNAEPPRDAFPLLALAQHHGLPTMLLDWTRRAWVAAYFAAVVAADPEDPAVRAGTKFLAVWALERGELGDAAVWPSFYEAPAWTNPNLRAQAGLFTWSSAEDDPSVEELIARTKKIIGGGPRIRRFTLPITGAGTLLRLLSQEGIDGASMFPGADGVVRAMRESSLWDRPLF